MAKKTKGKVKIFTTRANRLGNSTILPGSPEPVIIPKDGIILVKKDLAKKLVKKGMGWDYVGDKDKREVKDSMRKKRKLSKSAKTRKKEYERETLKDEQAPEENLKAILDHSIAEMKKLTRPQLENYMVKELGQEKKALKQAKNLKVLQLLATQKMSAILK